MSKPVKIDLNRVMSVILAFSGKRGDPLLSIALQLAAPSD